MTNNRGYVAVKMPEYVGNSNGDALRTVHYKSKHIKYRGVDREPWWDLDGAFYDHKLSEAEIRLRAGVKKSQIPGFSAGVCENLKTAQDLLSAANKKSPFNELIFISLVENQVLVERIQEGLRHIGFDYYVDGFGSIIRLGIFNKPKAFEKTFGMLNDDGLFGKINDLICYSRLYTELCRDLNLEVIDFKEEFGTVLSVFQAPMV